MIIKCKIQHFISLIIIVVLQKHKPSQIVSRALCYFRLSVMLLAFEGIESNALYNTLNSRPLFFNFRSLKMNLTSKNCWLGNSGSLTLHTFKLPGLRNSALEFLFTICISDSKDFFLLSNIFL